MNTSTTLDPRKARPMLVVLFASAFLACYNENIINMALVSLMAELHVDAVTSQWLVSGYMVVSTLMVVIASFTFRRFKIRPLFFFATGVLLASTVLAAFTPNFGLLLVFRMLQALGAGILIPLMMNSILLVAPREKLGTYMAIGSCMITFGPALAPVLSGVMVTLLGWRFVFLPVAVGAVAVICAGIPLLRNANPTSHLKADPLSIGLAAVCLFALVWGMSILSSSTPAAICGLAVAVAAFAGFVARQMLEKKAGREPLLDMAPLFSLRFFPACVLVMVAMTCSFSMSVLLPLLYEGSMGMSSMLAGLLLLVPVLVNAAVALYAGRVMDNSGAWPLLPVGFAIALAGMACCTVFGPQLSLAGVFVGSILVFAGVGCVMSPSQTAGLQTLPREQNSAGVSLLNVSIQVAACIAPSLFIGLKSSVEAANVASVGAAVAGGMGFSRATLIAAVVALVAAAIAAVYSRSQRRHNGKRA